MDSIDRFQPIAIIQKMKDIRHSLREAALSSPVDMTYDQWFYYIQGMKMALIWVEVEILTMAYDPNRHKE